MEGKPEKPEKPRATKPPVRDTRKTLCLLRKHGQSIEVNVGGERVTVIVQIVKGRRSPSQDATRVRLIVLANAAVKVVRSEIDDREEVRS